MTDPTEQTVRAAIAEGLSGCRIDCLSVCYGGAIPIDEAVEAIMVELGPRLAADLALAARVRACGAMVSVTSTDTDDFRRGARFGWDAALAYLLNGEQP